MHVVERNAFHIHYPRQIKYNLCEPGHKFRLNDETRNNLLESTHYNLSIDPQYTLFFSKLSLGRSNQQNKNNAFSYDPSSNSFTNTYGQSLPYMVNLVWFASYCIEAGFTRCTSVSLVINKKQLLISLRNFHLYNFRGYSY